MHDDEVSTRYKPVVNHEEQYSIWFADRPNPAGWNDAGPEGTKEECLDWIEKNWTDMRPLSLRRRLQELAEQGDAASDEPEDDTNAEPPLVERLTRPQPVVASRAKSAADLKAQIEDGFVLIEFVETRGGTELGFRLDQARSEWSSASFDPAVGQVRLVGGLNLDYTPVEIVAEIDLGTLRGIGHLEVVKHEANGA